MDRLKIIFSADHNITLDDTEAKEVYDLLIEGMEKKAGYLELELTHEGKSFVINVDKIRVMEYVKGD